MRLSVTAALAALLPVLVHSFSTTDELQDCDVSQSGYLPNHNIDPTKLSTYKLNWTGTFTSAETFYAKPLVWTPPGGGKSDELVIVVSNTNIIRVLSGLTGAVQKTRTLAPPFQAADSDCGDIPTTIGITGTPIIDPATNIMYFYSKGYKNGVAGPLGIPQGAQQGEYKLFAVNLPSLTDAPGFPISMETGLFANNDNTRYFLGGTVLQRPGLAMMGNSIIAGFGGHCDKWNYSGMLVTASKTAGVGVTNIQAMVARPGAPSPQPLDITEQQGGKSGIWQSGMGLAVDSSRSRVMFVTGNGRGKGELGGAAGAPRSGKTQLSTLEQVVGAFTVNPATGGLVQNDWFSPFDYDDLNGGDRDFGSSGVALLDRTVFSGGGVNQIAVATGKNGKVYIMDAENLGGFKNGDGQGDGVLQVIATGSSFFGGVGSYPGEGGYIYFAPTNDLMYAYKFGIIDGKPQFTLAGHTSIAFAGKGIPTITSLNGQPGTAVVWMADVNQGLVAFNAVPSGGLLTQLNMGSTTGRLTKFHRPVFGNTRVYTTQSNKILALAPPGTPPDPPPGSSTTTSATSTSTTSSSTSSSSSSTTSSTSSSTTSSTSTSTTSSSTTSSTSSSTSSSTTSSQTSTSSSTSSTSSDTSSITDASSSTTSETSTSTSESSTSTSESSTSTGESSTSTSESSTTSSTSTDSSTSSTSTDLTSTGSDSCVVTSTAWVTSTFWSTGTTASNTTVTTASSTSSSSTVTTSSSSSSSITSTSSSSSSSVSSTPSTSSITSTSSSSSSTSTSSSSSSTITSSSTTSSISTSTSSTRTQATSAYVTPAPPNGKTITMNWSIGWVQAAPDGFSRPFIGINGQWPPPPIVVNYGEQVKINVVNNMANESTAIHFHGLSQMNTTFEDGPAWVTQCPIPPGQSFVYQFRLTQLGTYWYHAHIGGQYIDGLRAPLIVKDPSPPFGKIDNDVTLTLTDMYHEEAPSLIHYYLSPDNTDQTGGAEPVPNSALINEAQNVKFPVTPGKINLFRVINMGAMAGQYLQFDQHTMTIVEVDGVYVQPYEVSQLFVAVAQRYSVIINSKADNSRNYAIVASMNADMFGSSLTPPGMQPTATAWLVYDAAKALPAPFTLQVQPFDDSRLFPLDLMPLMGPPTVSISLTASFGPNAQGSTRAYFNGKTYVSQKVPTLYSALTAPADVLNNPVIYGTGSNPYVLPYGAIVEISVDNHDDRAHPFHLHGHNFQLVSRGSGGFNFPGLTTPPATPMRRDTVTVYGQSSATIRFRADNPGIQLFHCHTEWHVEAGLTITLIEAPTELVASKPYIPASHREVCDNFGILRKGNAAGNSKNWLDLTGANTVPPVNNWGALTNPPS